MRANSDGIENPILRSIEQRIPELVEITMKERVGADVGSVEVTAATMLLISTIYILNLSRVTPRIASVIDALVERLPRIMEDRPVDLSQAILDDSLLEKASQTLYGAYHTNLLGAFKAIYNLRVADDLVRMGSMDKGPLGQLGGVCMVTSEALIGGDKVPDYLGLLKIFTEHYSNLSKALSSNHQDSQTIDYSKMNAETCFREGKEYEKKASELKSGSEKLEAEQNAVNGFLNAAGFGHPKALYHLYLHYKNRIEGKSNQEESLFYLQASAESGDAESQYELADTFWQVGRLEDAKIWYADAAKQNHLEAIIRLGEIEQKGLDGDKNFESALRHYQQALRIIDSTVYSPSDDTIDFLGIVLVWFDLLELLHGLRADSGLGDTEYNSLLFRLGNMVLDDVVHTKDEWDSYFEYVVKDEEEGRQVLEKLMHIKAASKPAHQNKKEDISNISEVPDKATKQVFKLISYESFPSLPAPWSGIDKGESWEWGDFLIAIQQNPRTVAALFKEAAGKAVPDNVIYHFVATAFYKPEKNPHGHSIRPIAVAGIEQSDLNALATMMGLKTQELGNSEQKVIGLFVNESHLSLGSYEGGLNITEARKALFQVIGRSLGLSGTPQNIGEMKVIKELISPSSGAITKKKTSRLFDFGSWWKRSS